MNKKRTNKLLKKYTKKRLRAKNVRFRVFYTILLALIAFGLYRLYVYADASLRAYESAQHTYVVEEMAAMFTEMRFEELFQHEDPSKLANETVDDYVKYLRSLTEGTYITYKEIPRKADNERLYRVTSNGRSFATFSIVKSGEVVKCGFLGEVELCKPGAVVTDFVQPITYRVTIPSDATLYINGEAAPASDIIKENIKTFATGYLPEGYSSYLLNTYEFTRSLGEPVLEARDLNGEPIILSETAQDQFEFVFAYADDSMKPVHEEQILSAAKAMCKFTSKSASQKEVLAFLKPGSNAESNIKNADAYWFTRADKYRFENERTENYVIYSDTLFSCELYMDYITTNNGKENAYPEHMRFFVTLVDGKWLIYEAINI